MAFALVSHVSRAGTGTSGAIDTTGADLLVAAVGWGNSNAVAFSDSKSNIWIPIGALPISAPASGLVQLMIAINPTVGSGHTFTVTGASSACVAAFSGSHLTFPLGQVRNAATAGAASLAPGSLTPPIDACLVIAALGDRTANTISVDGGFTITDQVAFSSPTVVGSCLAYLIQTSAAAANPTFSWTGSVIASAIIGYFQPPTAAAGGATSWVF